jgi:branched-chain amino acid transport system permease protein
MFAQQIVSGLATGSIIACLALALVLIYRSMNVINFAQGEMAMFATFIAWTLTEHGIPIWAAFAAAVLLAFAGGAALEWLVIRPVAGRSPLTIVIVTIGLLIALNGLAGWIWGYEVRSFPSPFPQNTIAIAGVSFSLQDVGIIVTSFALLLALYLFFSRTKAGLALRAAALYPNESRALGIRVGAMLALGWGLAAATGAIAGVMIAPVVFLEPNMMQGLIVYAFAAAVLGGLESPLGAVVGGLALGVVLNLIGAYVEFIGTDLRLPAAFAIIVLVLLVRPNGLFGQRTVTRV